jgi:hypothetical protein
MWLMVAKDKFAKIFIARNQYAGIIKSAPQITSTLEYLRLQEKESLPK